MVNSFVYMTQIKLVEVVWLSMAFGALIFTVVDYLVQSFLIKRNGKSEE